MHAKVIGRLAPSPTGVLHVGNARSLLAAWLSARAGQGKVFLRVEDLLPGQPEMVELVLDDLAWLGLSWDEPPPDPSVCLTSQFTSQTSVLPGFWLQSARTDAYRATLLGLIEAGLAYACVCTRKDIQDALRAPHAEDRGPRYAGTCRDRFASVAHAVRWQAAQAARRGDRPAGAALRLKVGDRVVRFEDAMAGPQEEYLARDVGDFVIRRKDESVAYMFAVVLDDIAMGVTEVVRGDDLLACTAQQLAVADAIAEHAPDAELRHRAASNRPRLVHIPLVYGDDGRRLAKRNKSLHVRNLQDLGVSQRRLMRWLVVSLGLPDPGQGGERIDLGQLAAGFDWDRVPRSGVLFGEVEFAAMQSGAQYSPIIRFSGQ